MTHFVIPLVRLSPPLGGIGRRACQAVCTLAVALRVRQERRALLDLDARALKDIGYSHGEASAEARRPIWDLPPARLRSPATPPWG
jgi:uncharacterized protein YjiS (DUF1127 family)